MRLLAAIWLITVTGSLLSGCDLLEPSAGERERYVVQMYLTAGEPIPHLTLLTVRTFGDPDQQSIPDAEVRLELLDDQGDAALTFPYVRANIFDSDTAQLIATHAPAIHEHRRPAVQPLTRYRLVIDIPEQSGWPGARLLSTTTVPDTFSVHEASADTLVYEQSEQLQLELTRSHHPERQAYYVITNTARADRLSADDFTPFAARLHGDAEQQELHRLRQSSSPVLNEANYTITADDLRIVGVPWLMYRFYGPNEVAVHAVDDNLYDFLRTHHVQQGGSTLAPGEMPNVIDHIDAGTGIFGSRSAATHSVFLRPQE